MSVPGNTAAGIAALATLLAVHTSCTDGGGTSAPAGTDTDSDSDADSDSDSDAGTDPGDCPLECLSEPTCETASGIVDDEHWCGDMQGDCPGQPTVCDDIGATTEEQQFGCCHAGVSYWCHEGEFWQLDCEELGYECGYSPEPDYMDCVPEATADFLVCCDTEQ